MCQSIQDLPLILNAKQLATALGISRSLAYQLFKQPDFPTVKIDSRLVVSRESFWNWFQNQEKKEDNNAEKTTK